MYSCSNSINIFTICSSIGLIRITSAGSARFREIYCRYTRIISTQNLLPRKGMKKTLRYVGIRGLFFFRCLLQIPKINPSNKKFYVFQLLLFFILDFIFIQNNQKIGCCNHSFSNAQQKRNANRIFRLFHSQRCVGLYEQAQM